MKKSIRFFLIIIFVLLSTAIQAQKPTKPNAAEIQLMLQKLNVLGNILYVAAHPDDENTRVIAYMANEKNFNTAYLSVTRGDGGQNLVGTEIRELLGLVRTQELLAARRIDGGRQFFTRANDFGYSKSAEETFNIWDKDEVLSDMVRVIRKFRPDIIITRFPQDIGGGHGHHTASAVLAGKAFDLVGDKKVFPEQIAQYGSWNPTRMMFNTHPFFYRRTGIEMDTASLVTLDLGTYNPLLGQSYPEIASLSRSMHKSQGFGSTGSRGTQIEYFEFIAGDKPKKDLFEGIDTSWNRVKGGSKVAVHVENAMLNFDPSDPSIIVDDLIKAYNALGKVKDDFWKKIKQKEIKELIKACAGLYLEIKADQYSCTPGDSIRMSIEAINRSDIAMVLTSINIEKMQSFEVNQKLYNNRGFNMDKKAVLPKKLLYSTPYWLREAGSLGMYRVDDKNLIGTPENSPALHANFTIKIGDTYLDYRLPVVFKRNDPVDGEIYRPLEISPPLSLNITDKVYVFGNGGDKEVPVKVIAGRDNLSGSLSMQIPTGWQMKPDRYDFELKFKGEEKIFKFKLTPPDNQQVGEIMAKAIVDGLTYDKSLVRIEYDHIPIQTLFPIAKAKIVKVDLIKRGQNIGYIMGTGDEIPASLRQIGYDVWEMQDGDISTENLKNLDAVILGIRAYNTVDRLKFDQEILMEYVKNGGTVIVQYNTSRRLVTKDISPYSLTLSRDRVTVEEAEIRILDENHPLIQGPNKITSADFEGWVQERGLYFPNEWDDKYTALLSSNDPGEDPKNGGLLVAQYGEGFYIYTGYSWFRQLPAGVAGAYRLFTNMISIGKDAALGEDQKAKREVGN